MRHVYTHYRAQSFHMLKISVALEMFRPHIWDTARPCDFLHVQSLPRAFRDPCECVSLCLQLDGILECE